MIKKHIIYLAFLSILIWGCNKGTAPVKPHISTLPTTPAIPVQELTQQKEEDPLTALEKITKAIIDKTDEKHKNIAVIEFSELNGEEYTKSAKGMIISERLITNLVNSGKVTVVERGQLEKVMQELKLNMKGVIDSSSAKEVGKILGIDALVTGTIIEIENTSEINARMIDTENGSILAAVIVHDVIKIPEQKIIHKELPQKAYKEDPVYENQMLKDDSTSYYKERNPPPPPQQFSHKQYKYAPPPDQNGYYNDMPPPPQHMPPPPHQYMPPPPPPDFRGENNNMMSSLLPPEHRDNRWDQPADSKGNMREHFEELFRQNRFDILLKEARKETEKHPDHIVARFFLGLSLVEIGIEKKDKSFFSDALKHLRFVMREGDRHPMLRKRSAEAMLVALFESGEREEARDMLKKILKHEPNLRDNPKIKRIIKGLGFN